MPAPPRAPHETEFYDLCMSPLEPLLDLGVLPDVLVEWHRDERPDGWPIVELHMVLLYGFDITDQLSDELKTALAVAIVKEETGR